MNTLDPIGDSVRAVERRMAKAVAILQSAAIPYALTDVGSLAVLSVFALARTKLATFRDRDRLNLRDLIDLGLIDQTWPALFPLELAARLQLLLDTPGG